MFFLSYSVSCDSNFRASLIILSSVLPVHQVFSVINVGDGRLNIVDEKHGRPTTDALLSYGTKEAEGKQVDPQTTAGNMCTLPGV